MNRSGRARVQSALIVLVAVLVLPLVLGYAEFDDEPFADFELTQNTTFTFDFNSTYTSNGSAVPEIGGIIRYDFSNADKEDSISLDSIFTFSTVTGVLSYTPSNDDATKNFTILFLLREPGEDGAVLDSITPRFVIANINDPPQITNATPDPEPLIATPEPEIETVENATVNLTVTAEDIDAPYGENLTVIWNRYHPDANGTFEAPVLINSSNETIDPAGGVSILNYTVGYCDSPRTLIEAIARDEGGLEDRGNWTMSVENVNRNITFSASNISNQTFNESEGLIANFLYSDYFIDPDDIECGDENLTWVLSGAVNTNISVNQTTGEVFFNATPEWSGNETVTIIVYDAAGTNATSNEFRIEVLQVPDPPIGFEPGPQTADEYAPFELFIRFEDSDLPFGDTLTFTLNDTTLFTVAKHNQSGNASYARISFTPDGGDAGSYAYTLTANDTQPETPDANVSFTLVIFPNLRPIIDTPIVLPNATQGTLYEALVNATDPDGDPISWYVALNASIDGDLDASVLGIGNLSVTIGGYPINATNDTQGNLTFTPTNFDVGNHSIRIYAVDSKGARTNTTTLLSVLNVNDPPEGLEPDDVIIPAKEVTEWTYTVTVDDPDLRWGDFVNVTLNDSAISITNLSTNGSRWLMNYTPPLLSSTNRSILITATDRDGLSTTANFTLRVLPALPPELILPTTRFVAEATIPYEVVIGSFDPNDDTLVYTFNETLWSLFQTDFGNNRTRINATYTEFDVGNYTINITVTDVDGMTDSEIVEFTIEPFNLPPELTNPQNMSFVNGTFSQYTFSVTDAEDDPWNVYFEDPFYSWLEITQLNNLTFRIGATPNATYIGFHAPILVINQTSYPPRNSTYVLNITVFSDPQPPEIVTRNPLTGIVPGVEAQGRVYSALIDDPNFPGPGSNESDRVTLVWTFNNETVFTEQLNESLTSEYSFEYGYCDSPGGVLTLTATDLWNLSTSTSWLLEIENVNRPPHFGERRFSYRAMSNQAPLTFANGAWIFSAGTTNVGDTGSRLQQVDPLLNGTITSPVLTLGREASINKANLTQVSVNGEGNITYAIRFSSSSPNTADPSWTNWSEPVPVGTFPGDLFVRQYGQVRFYLTSADLLEPAYITNATLHYEFRNITLNSSVTEFSYWTLTDYFTDPDYVECLDDTINASIVDSAPDLIITIDQTDFSVDLITDVSFDYTHYTNFFLNDSYGLNTTSNEFSIQVVERPEQVNVPQPTTGGSGGGGSSFTIITEPEEIEVDVPEPLEIITPGSATVTENITLSIPISIINRWNETLENIEIGASSENENITLELTLDTIPSLAKDMNETFELLVTSYATYGEYGVDITATVKDPEFNTTSTILINSIELGRRGDESYDTRLSFARDIVESNPRCIELNEHIERSRNLLASGQTEEAIALLDDIVENCRYLVNLEASTFFPLDERSWFERILQETSSQTQLYTVTILAVNLILFGMVGVYLFRNVRRSAKPPST